MRPPLRLPLFPSPTLFRSPGAHTAAGRVCEVRHQPPQVGPGCHTRSTFEARLDQANSRPRDSETEPGAGGSAGRAAAIVREGLAQGRSAHSQLERCLCTERRDSNEQDGRNREDVPHTASHTHAFACHVTTELSCRRDRQVAVLDRPMIPSPTTRLLVDGLPYYPSSGGCPDLPA